MSTTHPHLEKNTFNVSSCMSVVSVCTHVSVCLHLCVSVLARNCEPEDTITLYAIPLAIMTYMYAAIGHCCCGRVILTKLCGPTLVQCVFG